MRAKKYKDYSTEDFILDHDFMQWVLHPNQENNLFWNAFLEKYPAQEKAVKEAVEVIKGLQVTEPAVPAERLDRIYQNFYPANKATRKIGFLWGRVAAIFLLLISIGGLFYYFQYEKQSMPFDSTTSIMHEKGKVILPDGTVNEFETEQTKIRQMASGELTINNDTITTDEVYEETKKTAMTEVIIPYGKQSQISLADGTKIWLNAGSRLSYPESFSGNKRVVYLSGEAFFDVESDPDNVFRVMTEDMKIEVTGTRFNVTSYASDQETQAVLLEGKVVAGRNRPFSRGVELDPGERILYEKDQKEFIKERVDVELYSSWIDGYLIFENQKIATIIKKLERYYNQQIEIRGISEQAVFSGKLDLTFDLEKVLDNIAFSASFSVEKENENFLLKP